MKTDIHIARLGIMGYERCLALQTQWHRQIVEGQRENSLILVEHPAVLTLGRNAGPKNVKISDAEANGIRLISTNRGGDVTAHELGQLVAYPLFRLNDFNLGPKGLVSVLERVVVDVLARWQVQGELLADKPGVWVQGKKIASLGLRIKDRTSFHGIALNVSNSLEAFKHCIPCGIADCKMTSLQLEAKRQISMADLSQAFVTCLLDSLGPRSHPT